MDHWRSVFLVETRKVTGEPNLASATGSEKTERYLETGSEKLNSHIISFLYCTVKKLNL